MNHLWPKLQQFSHQTNNFPPFSYFPNNEDQNKKKKERNGTHNHNPNRQLQQHPMLAKTNPQTQNPNPQPQTPHRQPQPHPTLMNPNENLTFHQLKLHSPSLPTLCSLSIFTKTTSSSSPPLTQCTSPFVSSPPSLSVPSPPVTLLYYSEISKQVQYCNPKLMIWVMKMQRERREKGVKKGMDLERNLRHFG